MISIKEMKELAQKEVKAEKELAKVGANVVYLPYTEGVNSTGLREEEGRRVKE